MALPPYLKRFFAKNQEADNYEQPNQFLTKISGSDGSIEKTNVNSEDDLRAKVAKLGVKDQKYTRHPLSFNLTAEERQALADAAGEETFYTILKRDESIIAIRGNEIKIDDAQRNLIISALNKIVGREQTGISATSSGENIIVNFGTEIQFAFNTAVKLKEERLMGIAANHGKESGTDTEPQELPKTIREMIERKREKQDQLATLLESAKQKFSRWER